MIIENIFIKNFRNYTTLELSFDKGINIIYGKNAQGKTNLLEAIYVLALTKSHRSSIDNNLIKNNEDKSKIIGNFILDKISSKFEIILEKKEKRYYIDSDIIKKTSDYISKINIIIFYPEDLELIKGAPNTRRRYINLELSQLYSNYYKILNDYNKLLKMRNDYIKSMVSVKSIDYNYFNVLTNYLIEKSIIIMRYRKKFIDKINEKCEKIFFNISKIHHFNIKYENSLEIQNYKEEDLKDIFINKFAQLKEKEIRYKTTLLGPHRDDFIFYIDNMNLKNYGSQGQQRLAVLSLKLSEVELFKKYKGKYPILLLDDVFSELDINKKNNLLFYIKNNIQTIITTTDLTNIDKSIKEHAKLIEIDDATIKKIEEVK